MRDSATLVNVRLVYLARLREAFGSAGEAFAVGESSAPTVRDVISALRERGGAFATELDGRRAVRVAVNHTMVTPDHRLRDGDEVALFPPVTGG